MPPSAALDYAYFSEMAQFRADESVGQPWWTDIFARRSARPSAESLAGGVACAKKVGNETLRFFVQHPLLGNPGPVEFVAFGQAR
jgi:hypothetical protein